MPFLLPMMFQLGFGLSAAQSGLITFASSIGSLAMRTCAPWFLQAARVPQRADLGRRAGDGLLALTRRVPAGLAAAADLRVC